MTPTASCGAFPVQGVKPGTGMPFGFALGRAAFKIATDLRSLFVQGAGKQRASQVAPSHDQRRTVSVAHSHERAVADEMSMRLRSLAKSAPVGARDGDKLLRRREAARTTTLTIVRELHPVTAICRLPGREQSFPFAPMSPYVRARRLIDDAHAADPTRTADGRPAELVYGERMDSWVSRLVPDASPLLRLAARAQHLERWRVPRASFPMDKAGYHAWRRSLYTKQAQRARELLLAAGVPEAEAAEVATWVSKSELRTNAGTQALEDAACLVFLESEIHAFAAQHAEYPREKFVEILRKTWRKMTPRAQEFALALELPPAIAALVREAVADVPATKPGQSA